MRPPHKAEYSDMNSDAKPDKPASADGNDPAAAPAADVGAVTQRVHADVARQMRSAFDELVAAARADAERAADAKMRPAVEAAFKNGREQALAEAREETARAVREALAGAEQTSHMAIEAADSAARARIAAIEQSVRAQIEAVERESRRDLEDAKAAHQAKIDELEAATKNQVAAAEESARQRVKDIEAAASEQLQALEAQARKRIEVAVAAATTAARADLRSSDGAATERLLDAFRAIDRARSLTEILDTTAACAAREAAAVALLLVRGRRFQGWRAMGFGTLDGGASSIAIDADEGGILTQATDGNTLVSGGPAPSFAPDSKSPVAIPLAISGSVVAVLYADQGAASTPGTPASRTQPLEAIARHAARALESMTAFKTARALAAGHGSAGKDEASDDDTAAKRYARLLISEIRLYHEAAVTAGKRERDLATRLGGEIARARSLYEQRVPRHVRQRVDHFRDELVRTLADGDAALVDVNHGVRAPDAPA